MRKLGRNDPCSCGSGKKHKKCCGKISKTESDNIVDFSNPFDIISSDFLGNGIDVSEPGFYDHPAFISVEKKYPKYLNNYARYVQTQNYSSEYLDRAKKEIPFIAKVLHEELVKDGRLGACIDISMVLSRILEMEGYWNYIVKGALTLIFQPDSGIRTKHYWPIDFTNAQAGHVWVAAPPFNIIDITIKQQPFHEGEERFLPDYVIEEGYDIATVEFNDIFSPEARLYLRKSQGIIESKLIPYGAPEAAKVINVFKPYYIQQASVKMKYITVAISAPDSPLKNMKNLCLLGRYGDSIYKEIIIPSLKEFRQNFK